jgi:hypothetical protein
MAARRRYGPQDVLHLWLVLHDSRGGAAFAAYELNVVD